MAQTHYVYALLHINALPAFYLSGFWLKKFANKNNIIFLLSSKFFSALKNLSFLISQYLYIKNKEISKIFHSDAVLVSLNSFVVAFQICILFIDFPSTDISSTFCITLQITLQLAALSSYLYTDFHILSNTQAGGMGWVGGITLLHSIFVACYAL